MGSIQKYCDRVILLNKGKQLIDASPKVAIDLFNKLSVMENGDVPVSGGHKTQETQKDSNWKLQMSVNPKTVEYGNRDAIITDFCICDSSGNITNNINKGDIFTVKMKVYFNISIEDPIFAFTIKDIKGTELTGSNTLLGEKLTPHISAGQVVTITFSQKMNLRCNEYLLALGCTGYRDGKFTVYHRLYDVCHIMVLSEKDTVGIFDMYSKINVDIL